MGQALEWLKITFMTQSMCALEDLDLYNLEKKEQSLAYQGNNSIGE